MVDGVACHAHVLGTHDSKVRLTFSVPARCSVFRSDPAVLFKTEAFSV